jgi:autoinducer 2-binding periplasmic protein LuxP
MFTLLTKYPVHWLLIILLALAVGGPVFADEHDDDDNAYWEHYEVPGYDEEVYEAFREVVRADAVPISVDVDEITIALVFPALDLSDAWARGHAGLVGRLDELEIPYQLDTFGGDHDDHTLQLSHLETVLARGYDYAIVGPTEILVQMSILEELIESGTQVIVWNYTTPLRDWGEARFPEGGQPLGYVGFSHADGAHVLGQYFVERLLEGVDGTPRVAHIRGIPGITDDQRSGIAKQYFEEAGFEIVHETYANWDRTQGYNATLDIVGAYPDVDHIHIVSTAMAIGAVEALDELGRAGEILINGWGGGSEEQIHMLDGNLHATVMRMQDDWGVALAEMIKFHLEDRVDEIPLAFSGENQLVDDTFTREDIDEILDYAFRYSGDLEVYR